MVETTPLSNLAATTIKHPRVVLLRKLTSGKLSPSQQESEKISRGFLTNIGFNFAD